MKVELKHTREFPPYCTSCGAEIGQEHTVSPRTVCFYIQQKYPKAMEVIRGIEDEEVFRVIKKATEPRSGFGLRYKK